MTVLVADVGGTNTRIALTTQDGDTCEVTRFENDAFTSFGSVLDRFVASNDVEGLSACRIAIAGPVAGNCGRLTNRDWRFDPVEIASHLPGLDCKRVHLVNDLAALGHALPSLADDQLTELRPGTAALDNGQALVAGLGTGFNVCLVKTCGHAPAVVEAELGHASLPSSVRDALTHAIGSEASGRFRTNEGLFSGRGLSRLFAVFADGQTRHGQQIIASYDPLARGAAADTVELLARLLGVFARQLVFQYMPYGGIHFAGGAARGILGSDACNLFLDAFETPGRFSEQILGVPLRLISDDTAALTGLSRLAPEGKTLA